MLDKNFCADTNILTSKEMVNNSPTRGSVMLLNLVLLLLSRKIGLVDGHKATATSISNHNYPVEEHTVITYDDYILTIYRIPSSPNRSHLNRAGRRAVVFLQHGILSASDDWIINGPEASLAYMLADAGYDVWLGNARGNTYSRQHKHIHPDSSDFWRFSWHEIGVYDLAAMLDYALAKSQSSSLHFVAHSQGTTAFFVLMSSLPLYNEKLRSVHLLAPIAYMRYHSFILSKLGGIFLGTPSFLSWVLSSMELLPITNLQKLICEHICASSSMFNFLCSGLLDFIGGWGTRHLNQQPTPPSYNVQYIKSCVDMYYSENDYMSAVGDVKYLASLLPCAQLYRIPFGDWNHYDFLWSNNVKEVINNKIIQKMRKYDEDGVGF